MLVVMGGHGHRGGRFFASTQGKGTNTVSKSTSGLGSLLNWGLVLQQLDSPRSQCFFRCLEVVSDCPAPHLFAATYRPCRPWLPGLPGCTSASQLCCRYAASNWTDRTAPYPPAEQKSIGEASMNRLPMRWKPETNGAVFSWQPINVCAFYFRQPSHASCLVDAIMQRQVVTMMRSYRQQT